MRGTVGGLALACVGLACPFDAEAGVKEVTIEIDSACNSSAHTGEMTLKKTRRDVVVWTVSSACAAARHVRVCVFGGKPLRNCKGDPEDAKLDDIEVAAGTNATVTCNVKWSVVDGLPAGETKRYPFKVILAPTDDLDCEPKPCPPGTLCPTVSELALEVEP